MTVDKDGASVVANNSSEKLGPWMIMARKGRPKVVVDKENITDSERNQRNNYSTTSRFAALTDDPDTNSVTKITVQNPIIVPP